MLLDQTFVSGYVIEYLGEDGKWRFGSYWPIEKASMSGMAYELSRCKEMSPNVQWRLLEHKVVAVTG